MMISGTSPDNALVEAIEYSDHPFYVGFNIILNSNQDQIILIHYLPV